MSKGKIDTLIKMNRFGKVKGIRHTNVFSFFCCSVCIFLLYLLVLRPTTNKGNECMKKLSKHLRQEQLQQLLENDPFITDETLSHEFNVSIQTIRLDRLELNIPELRERIKNVAVKSHDEIRTLSMDDIIGEVIDIELDHMALSILDIKKEHVFSRNNIARGHYLFAQANSLCVALINDEFALTVSSNIHFQKPVMFGDRVITKAVLIEKKDQRAKIEVFSTVNQSQVFYGEFEMYYNNKGA